MFRDVRVLRTRQVLWLLVCPHKLPKTLGWVFPDFRNSVGSSTYILFKSGKWYWTGMKNIVLTVRGINSAPWRISQKIEACHLLYLYYGTCIYMHVYWHISRIVQQLSESIIFCSRKTDPLSPIHKAFGFGFSTNSSLLSQPLCTVNS